MHCKPPHTIHLSICRISGSDAIFQAVSVLQQILYALIDSVSLISHLEEVIPILHRGVPLKQQTDEFLVKNDLDSNILKKVRDNTVELKDLPSIRKALDVLNSFQTNPVCTRK